MEERTKATPGRVFAAVLVALLLLALANPAGARRPRRYWLYDKSYMRHEAKQHFPRMHRGFHRRSHPHDGRRHGAFHNRLRHRHRRAHFHRPVEKQAGEASWYDHGGSTGACGVPLQGRYAAHPSWPCGSLVSVKHGEQYVFVTVLDRGPYAGGRIIDLSPTAFERIAPLGGGVANVEAFLLER